MPNNKILDVMFGHAIGDALGVPVEFCNRDFLKANPVTGMRGFGTHKVPAGTWSDDTSMSLCTLESLSKGIVSCDDIMSNFGKWYYHGDYTTDGRVFDIGGTCANAIDNYFYNRCSINNCGIDDISSNGNGSLMRIHPIVLYAYYNNIKDSELHYLVSKISALTHAHECSLEGCMIYTYVLKELLNNPIKESIYNGLSKVKENLSFIYSKTYYNRLLNNDMMQIHESEIKSSGYVVDTLEAATWCVLTTENYKDCVLKAVSLGNDTDTVAAVAGGLAGALYGINSIPYNWMNTLKRKDYIYDMCERAYEKWRENDNKNL